MCNNEGQWILEQLRDLIKTGIDVWKDRLELEKEQSNELPKPKITITDVEEKPRVISHGKISDDNGNVVGIYQLILFKSVVNSASFISVVKSNLHRNHYENLELSYS